MSQILKLSNGDQVKNRKQQELDQIALNRQKIKDAYDSGSLSEESKAQLDMISKNAQAYLQADPLHNKNARKFQLELTNRMADIVDGNPGYTPYQTEIADKNIFGRYSDNEMGLIANELIRKTLNSNTNSPSTTQTVSQSPSSQEEMHHIYDWLGGYNLDLMPQNMTDKQKVNYILRGLKKGIDDAEQANASGKMIHGFDPSKIQEAKQRLSQIQIEDSDTDEAAFNKLVSQIQDGMFAVPADTFKSLFSKYYGGSESTDATTQAAKELGYELADSNYLSRINPLIEAIGDNGKIYKKGNKYYALDSDLNPILSGYSNIDSDSASSTYNKGIFIGDNGEIFISDDVTNVSNIPENWSQKVISAVENVKNQFSSAYNPIEYDFFKQTTTDALINHLRETIGHKFTAYDVSNLVAGSDKVLAVSPSGAPIKKDYYNKLVYPEDTRFYVLDDNGELKMFGNKDYATRAELAGYKSSGWNETQGSKQIGLDITDLDLSGTEQADLYRAFGKAPGTTTYTLGGYGLSKLQSRMAGQKPENDVTMRVGQQPDVYIKNLLDDIIEYNPNLTSSHINPRNKEYEDNKYESLKKLISVILYYNQNPNAEHAEKVRQVLNDKKYQDILYQILYDYGVQRNKGIVSDKNGGILYAQQGGKNRYQELVAQVDRNEQKRQSDIKAQREQGYSKLSRYKYGQRELKDGLRPEDWLRFGAMAADVVSIISNFSGAGAPVAAGAGALSAGTQLVADFADPSVGFWQASKNLGINAGLAALSLVPGIGGAAKGAKTIKQIAQWAPRVMLAANTLGLALDQDVKESWKRVQSGKPLTANDLKNIGWTLTSVAGLGRGARNIANSVKKVGPNGERAYQLIKGKTTKSYSFTDKKGNKITLDENRAQKVTDLLNEGKEKEALSVIREVSPNAEVDFEAKRSIKNPLKKNLDGKSKKLSLKEETLKEPSITKEQFEQILEENKGTDLEAYLRANYEGFTFKQDEVLPPENHRIEVPKALQKRRIFTQPEEGGFSDWNQLNKNKREYRLRLEFDKQGGKLNRLHNYINKK